jgi:hypothetical protein
LLESGVSDPGGVNGVTAPVEPSSKILEVAEDKLELDVKDAVALFRRNGVLRGGLSNAL